jgi:hypothetical protein
MPATVEQVREQLADEIKGLAASVKELDKGFTTGINDLRTEFAEFKGEVKKDLRWIFVIGCGLIAFLAWGVKKGFDLSYEAGALTTRVAANAVQAKDRFDQLEKRMDKTDAKVDLILQRLDQVVAKTGGGK